MNFKLLLFFTFSAFFAFSQAPQRINYQGLARNSAGVPIVNRPLVLKFELRQGSATSATVFTEEQSVTTNSLGLFTTQIGKTTTAGLSQVNWANGPTFMQLWVDTASNGNFTDLGVQEMLSVPYALHAQSVPSAFSNTTNVLTIGAQSYTLNSGAMYTAGNGISMTGSVISNAAPDQTIAISGNSNVQVNSAYPNFTINATPTLNYSGNDLSISEGNTVTIAPGLSISGNTLSVGPLSNTVLLPAGSSATIQGAGIATVSTLGANDFLVNVAAPVFNGTGATNVSGTYPNFTINTPSTNITGGGATTVGGNFPNFTVSTPSTNITGGGATTVGGNFPNFTVSTPSTNIIGGGATTVGGNFPNFTVSTPSTNITGGGAITVGGNFPNFTVSTPSTNLTGAGITTVSGVFPNYVVNTPATNITASGASSVSGTFPNFNIGTPVTNLNSAGAITIAGNFPNFTIGTPSVNVTATGASTVSGSFPNFNVNTPATGITGGGAITVGGAYPNFSISTPSVSVTGSGISTVSGAFPNYAVNTPSPNITGAGATTVSGVFPNYSVNTPVTNITGVGVTSVIGTFPNFTVATPMPPTATVTGSGLALVSPSTGLSFNVNVPVLTYTSANGFLSSGTNSVNITPLLSFTNGILSAGPASNSLAVNSGSNGIWSTLGNANITPSVNFLGTTDANVLNFRTNNVDRMQINAQGFVAVNAAPTSSYNLYAHRDAMNVGDYGPGKATLYGYRGGSNVQANGGTGWAFGQTDAAVQGHSFWGNNYSAGVAGHNFNDYPNSAGVIGANYGGSYWGALAFNDGNGVWGLYSPFNAYVGGFFGVGTTSPTERLDVSGSIKVVDGTQGNGKMMISDAAGKGYWRNSPPPIAIGNLNIGTVLVTGMPTNLNIGSKTFNKIYPNTEVEITLHSRAFSGTNVILFPYNWIKFEIMVDNSPATVSTEHYLLGPNITDYIDIKAVFSNLAVGSHTITIRAYTDGNSANGVMMDPGNFGGKFIVQEKF